MSEVILVTGGTGFAGSHLVELLVAESAGEVHVTQFSSSEKNSVQGLSEVVAHSVDLTNAAATEAVIEVIKPTQIYHLASFAYVGKSFEKGAEVLHNNVTLQFNLLNAVKKHAPDARILMVGSAEEYGMSVDSSELPITENHPFRPVNPYAVSKIAQDMLAYSYFQSYKMNIIRVRPFNHIGERQTGDFAVPAFARQIVAIERGQEKHLKVGNLTGIRDFTYVKDMVAAYKLVMEKGALGEVYNIGSGTGITMQQIVEELKALAKVPIQIEVDESLLRPLDIPVIVANNEKVTALGWHPKVSIQESLAKVVEYWRTL
jgi:GDP-4-dehydro-6-deoxy-D-mannose reductase